ncbi:MAG TPA: hypothetical protein VG501_01605 [Rhizomicrobium sp.]|nr:hypothetical protein [Rhizomicrobium sp.]
MSPYAKSALTWASVIAGLIVFFGIRYALVQGVFNSVAEITPGTCRPVAPGLKGPNDLLIDVAHNLLLIAARDGRNPDPHDGIYLLKLDDPAAPPQRLAGTPADFHPTGLSLYRDASGKETLMAIDDGPNGRKMVQFYGLDFSGEAPTASQESVVQSGAMVSPHDVAAVGENQFYVTNDHVTHDRLGRFAEDYLLWPHADVLLYNGMGFRIVTQRIAMPSGILARGAYLYLAAANERRVIALSREDFTGNLDEIGSLSIPARLNHLTADAQGDLIVAGETRPGSAQVFRVRLGPDGKPLSYETIFSDDGHLLKGASSAAVHDGHLFIGSAEDSKMLECDFKN